MKTRSSKLPFLFAVAILILSGFELNGQTRKNRATVKPATKAATVESEKEDPPASIPSTAPAKRNERRDAAGVEDQKPTAGSTSQASTAQFRYEFSQPEFVVSKIVIEHNESGSGTISFLRQNNSETISDPIIVSRAALERINRAVAALNFLDSREDYQYPKDFSHLGTIRFSYSRHGRSREVSINWTENKEMKAILNEYRKLGHQFIWIFDISLSRENQPLESPKLLRSLDSMMARNDISDPQQLEPLLIELSNDERIPLIARNHAARLVKQIEKLKLKASR